jgi:hypothetical protein
MSNKESRVFDDIATFFQAAMVELPAAAARQMVGETPNQDEVQAIGWKAYDAFVRVANESANQLYANPMFGEAAARSLEFGLQIRRVGDALTSAFFRDLLPVIGLPDAREIARLTQSVEALREQVHELQSAHSSAVRDNNVVHVETNHEMTRSAGALNAAPRTLTGLKPSGLQLRIREKKSVAL